MTPPALLELARDPTLIKGIHDVCDQWCMYCAVTNRCLAFRCNPEVATRNGDVRGDDNDDVLQGLMVVKVLADAEGRAAPIEVEAALSTDREERKRLFTLRDSLERMGARYMNLSNAYLCSRPDFPFDIALRATGPTPLEVFAWFHDLVPARIFRALLSAAAAEDGLHGRYEDALGAAKLVLVGIDRSLEAIAAVRIDDDDPRLELMQEHLGVLRQAVESRFPAARSFMRHGLDTQLEEC